MEPRSYDVRIAELSRDIQQRSFLLENYLEYLKQGDLPPAQAVYKFQAMCDGLIDLKKRADDLTAPLDHG